MKIVRIYSGSDGESYFDEVELSSDIKELMEISKVEPATGIYFRSAPPGHTQDWHTASRRQYLITLSGQVEIEIGDGTVRRFGPGDVMLAEDLTGRGHITRVVGNQPRFYATVILS